MEIVVGVVNLPLSDPLSNHLILQLIITLSCLLFLGYCYKKLPEVPLKLSYRDRVFTMGPRGQKIFLRVSCLILNLWTSFLLLDGFLPEENYHFWRLLIILPNLLIFYYFPKEKP